jgi:hypothetical protein
MKLTTIALASVLAVTSSMAFAQETGGAGGGAGAGTSGAAATGAAGSSRVDSSTGTGTATTGSSNGPISGSATGTYPTLVTPGGMPSSVPAPGAIINR